MVPCPLTQAIDNSEIPPMSLLIPMMISLLTINKALLADMALQQDGPICQVGIEFLGIQIKGTVVWHVFPQKWKAYFYLHTISLFGATNSSVEIPNF